MRRHPMALLVLLPFIAHLPELVGLVSTNPIYFVSDLVLHRNAGLLPGKPFIDDNAGQSMLALGRLAADQWLHFQVPWWNHYTGIGLPLASEMQPAAFFLPFNLLLHFHAGVLLIKLAMQVLTGLATWLFLRKIGLLGWAALLASILFQFNGTFAWYADAPILPIAFLPLLLLGLERCRLREPGGEALVAISIAYSLTAGFPETAFLDGLLALVWAAARALDMTRADTLAFAWRTAAGGLIGLALAAPVLIPFLQDLQLSSLGMHDASAAMSLDADHLAGLFFPYLYGTIFADLDFRYWVKLGGFIGTAALFLGILSLFQAGALPRPERRMRMALALWAGLGTCVLFHVPGITLLVRLLPGLGTTQLCRYTMVSISFATCVLAGMALDDYQRRRGGLAVRVPLTLLGAFLATALLIGFDHAVHDIRGLPGGTWFVALSLLWGAGSLVSLAFLLRAPACAARKAGIAGVLTAEALLLFVPAILSGTNRPGLNEAPLDYLRAHQGFARTMSGDRSLFPNAGALYRLGSVQYEYTPVPEIWSRYAVQALDPGALPTSLPGPDDTAWSLLLAVSEHRAALEGIGVRFVVAPTATQMFHLMIDADHPVRVFSDGGIDIFELPAARPYASAQGASCTLTLADRDHLHAECDGPAKLIRRELFFPGWGTRVNGRRTPVTLDGALFQSVPLPQGGSDIVFRYLPMHIRAIALLFIAGLAGMVAASARLFTRRRHG